MGQGLGAQRWAASLEPRSLSWAEDPMQTGMRRQRLTGGIEPANETQRVHVHADIVQVGDDVGRSSNHGRAAAEELIAQACRQTEPVSARLPRGGERAVLLHLTE